jgi:hypothetical protein
VAFRASCRAAKLQAPPSCKRKRRAGRKHVLPISFYGNGGTKFPKLTTGDVYVLTLLAVAS